jgi:hypothetical protein
LPHSASWSTRLLSYEELGDAYARRVLPQRAVLLPIKRTPQFGRDPINESIAYVLKDWLAKRSHLMVVLPSRRIRDVFGDPESVLRRSVLELVRDVFPAADFVEECTPVPARELSSPSRTKIVDLRPALVQFGLSMRMPTLPSSVSALVSRNAASGGADGQPQPRFPVRSEILAENEFGHPVALSMPVSSGRVTLVPRGMFAGDLETVNEMIPELEVLEFDPSFYATLSRLQMDDDRRASEIAAPESTASPAPGESVETVKAEARVPSCRGRSKSRLGHQRLHVFLNGRKVTVTARGWWMLERIWRAEADAITKGLKEPAVELPRSLTSKATRKQVIFRLRKTFERVGAEVLCEPNPGDAVRLAPRAIAGLFPETRGFEIPPTWPRVQISRRTEVKPLRGEVKPPTPKK